MAPVLRLRGRRSALQVANLSSDSLNGICECGKPVYGDELREKTFTHMGERESGEAAPPRREMAGAMGEGKGKPTRREQKAAEELETQTSRLKVLHAAVANACCFRVPPSHPQRLHGCI